MSQLRSVDEKTHEVLVRKCQENPWLSYGGYLADLDPSLDERPYVFVETDDIEELHAYFLGELKEVRCGIVFEDLAFIQQEDLGDEFWVLKEDEGAWFEIDSISFRMVACDKARFVREVRALQCPIGEMAAVEGRYVCLEQAEAAMDEMACAANNRQQIRDIER